MIVCQRCKKENEDHYKFCLGCGSELLQAGAPQVSFRPPTSPDALKESKRDIPPAAKAVEKKASEPPPAATSGTKCPSCDAEVPEGFKFCGSCGHKMDGAAAAPAPAAPAAQVAKQGKAGELILIQPDGSEGARYAFNGTIEIGRDHDEHFAGDAFLSPKHARFEFGDDTLVVQDLDSLNGVYVRIEPEAPHVLEDGSVFRIGQEVIRFEGLQEGSPGADGATKMGCDAKEYCGRIRLIVGPEKYGNAFCVPNTGLHLGRERGDVIFPEDGYVSGLHCRIFREGDKVFVVDVGSSNGTFIRVGTKALDNGALVLTGQQLFQVSY